MGAKRWAKSLETFTFDNNRAIWSKVCKPFALQMWQRKVARRKKYRFGVLQKQELFSRVTQLIHNHAGEPRTTHTTPNMDMDNEIESIDNQSEEVAVVDFISVLVALKVV